MPAKLTKEEIRKRVENKIKFIYESEGRQIVLVDIIYPEHFTVDNIKLKLSCPKHPSNIETCGYISFMRYSYGWFCKYCSGNKIDKLEGEKRIEDYLEGCNLRQGTNIQFIGFQNNEWLGAGKKTIVEFLCVDHNERFSVKYADVFKNDTLYCSTCRSILVRERFGIYYTAESAQKAVNEKFKNDTRGYDFSHVEESFSGYDQNVDLYCPKHGLYHIQFRNLINSRLTTSGKCPHCELERKRLSQEEATRKIDEVLKIKTSVEFLGFVGGEYKNNTTKLILKCKIHDIVWETTTFSDFIDLDNGSCCPKCKIGTSQFENKVYNYLVTLDTPVERQHKVVLADRTCYIDFYLPDYNLFIEANGTQHYEYVGYLQDTYQDFCNQVIRDNQVFEYCKKSNINLLVIPWEDRNSIEKIIESYLVSGIDITTKKFPKLLPTVWKKQD